MAERPTPIIIDYDVLGDVDYNILPTHWFDLINTISSSFSSRGNFKFLNEFYVDGTYSFTTQTQPFDGYGDCYLNDSAKDYLSYDENWFSVAVQDNPNSFKESVLHYGEGFSRRLELTTIEAFTYSTGSASSTIIKIYFEPGTSLLEVNDRILVVKTDGQVRSYNTYGKILSISNINGWLITDIPYESYGYDQTGYVIEGVEYFDYNIVNSIAQITTTNAHNFNINDKIVIQMDNNGRASFLISGSSPGDVITGIWIDGVNIMQYTVTYTTTLSAFIDSVVICINSSNSIDGFRAYRSTSDYVYLFTSRNNNYFYQGMGLSYSGSVGIFTASTIRYIGGTDELGKGYNPQITGYYTINSIVDDYNFTLDRYLPTYYNNEGGSDRGTIYATTDYKFKDLTIGSTYSYLFASIDTQSQLEPISSLADVLSRFYTNIGTLPYFLSARNIIGNNGDSTYRTTMYNIDFYNKSELFTIDLFNTIGGIKEIDAFKVERVFATYSDSLTFSNCNIYDTKITMGIGPWNLNEFYALNPGDVSPFTNPGADPYPIPDDIISYQVSGWHTATSSNQVTPKLKFTQRCSDRTTIQLCWLNEWSGWDYYTFNMPIQTTTRYSRDNFYKSGNYRSGVTQITSAPKSRGETPFILDKSTELNITTRHLTLDQCRLIESMLASPYVYLITPNTPHDSEIRIIYPVVVLNSDLKQHNAQSKMKFYDINIRMSGYNYFNRTNMN